MISDCEVCTLCLMVKELPLDGDWLSKGSCYHGNAIPCGRHSLACKERVSAPVAELGCVHKP
jgi:hypothetical protein